LTRLAPSPPPLRDPDLRTIEIEGDPWFAAADVCRCLGLKAHPSNGGFTGHLEKLARDEKRVQTVEDAPTNPNGGAPGKRRMTMINETGLYRLIMRSDKATARPFQDWVTGAGEGD
jgi:prophage antirepressor-like protein